MIVCALCERLARVPEDLLDLDVVQVLILLHRGERFGGRSFGSVREFQRYHDQISKGHT